MNGTQHPEVAAAIRAELILQVASTPVSRRSRHRMSAQVRPPQRRVRRAGAIATGVTLVLVLAASVAAISLSARAPGMGPAAAATTPPASIEVDGKTVPSAGVVPWSNAVADDADPRVITISASGSVPNRTTWFCTLSQWRAAAVETATSVRIEVRGYAVPLDPDAYCNASNPPPHAVRITLDAPLGTRTLIDVSTMRPQPVLDAADVPVITVLPSLDTQTVTWDQESKIATRTYADPARPSSGSVSLETGTPAALAASGAVSGAPEVSDVMINGAPASLWSFESSSADGRTRQIEWTDRTGVRLRIVAEPFRTSTGEHGYTEDELILLAESVRSATR